MYLSNNCVVYTKDPTFLGMLVMQWHKVHYAYDIPHMVQYIQNSHPDLVILDLGDGTLVDDPTLDSIIHLTHRVVVRSNHDMKIWDCTGCHFSHFPADTPDEMMIEEIGKNPEQTIKLAEESLTQNKTILIIEDNVDIQEMYVLAFKSRWYTVATASDGLEGIARAAEIRPRVIILDIMMPHMDGFEVLHTIRNNTSIQTTVVVNSNLEWVDEERKVKQLGADYFLRKSQYTPLEVITFIEKEILGKDE